MTSPSNSSQSTRPAGRVLREELLVLSIFHSLLRVEEWNFCPLLDEWLLISCLPGKACWIMRLCRAFQHAFWKPSLVHLTSKDTNLVFYLSVYLLVHSSNWRLLRYYWKTSTTKLSTFSMGSYDGVILGGRGQFTSFQKLSRVQQGECSRALVVLVPIFIRNV